MTAESLAPTTGRIRTSALLAAAWAAMLLTSSLPQVLFHEFSDGIPSWLVWVQLGVTLVLFGLTFAWPAVRPLRPLSLILLTIVGGGRLITLIDLNGLAAARLPGNPAAFTPTFLGEQAGRLALTLLVLAVLWLIYRDRRRFFLAAGDPRATAAPIRWIGHTRPAPWSRLGPIAGALISLGTLAFLWLAARPTIDEVTAVLPLLPVVLLVAALNAFNETMTYRASFLAALEIPAGAAQALLMAAVWFGVGHYFGVPYGPLGAIMATFLGWFLGRSVLETRGSLWAWIIHFLQDLVIFSFLAMSVVSPGG